MEVNSRRWISHSRCATCQVIAVRCQTSAPKCATTGTIFQPIAAPLLAQLLTIAAIPLEPPRHGPNCGRNSRLTAAAARLPPRSGRLAGGDSGCFSAGMPLPNGDGSSTAAPPGSTANAEP